MIEIGRLCMKVAGRDAGKTCVVVDVVNDGFVTVDGQVKRKRCNIKHLEPMKQTIDIKKGASHEDVKSALKKVGVEVVEKKPKQKKEQQPKVEKLKAQEEKSAKDAKKEVKKPVAKKAKE